MLHPRRLLSLAAIPVLTAAFLVATSTPATAAPLWKIKEARASVSAIAGIVVNSHVNCPAGYSVIGGDIRAMSDFRYILVKTAMPEWGNARFVATVAIDANNGSQTFDMVAYCVESALVAGTSVQQAFFNPPGGALGTGPAGGRVECAVGQAAIGGGARVWDHLTSGTGHLLANGPGVSGNNWYASAKLHESSVLVEALCLPAASVPNRTVSRQVVDNTVGTYVYFVGSPSAQCPQGTRVLAGGGYTALNNQFPNPADPSQGRYAASHSETGYWYATVGMPHGYESTTTVWCIPDANPPVVSMTAPGASPLDRVVLPASVDLAWTGTDAADFVSRYQVRWRRAPYNGGFGPWHNPTAWQNLTTTHVTATGLDRGFTYCYQVRGQDPAGNWSAWNERCAVRPLDDRSLARSTGWTLVSSTDYWGGTVTKSSTQNAKLTLRGANFRHLGLVATTCPRCGMVGVYVNGALLGTVNLVAPSRTNRVLFVLGAVEPTVGTVAIKVLTSGKPVWIDGLVVAAK